MAVKAGYLPLYIKLYDDDDPHMRDPMVAHMERMVCEIRKRGVELVVADVCRTRPEFEKALELFEREQVSAVITQHLAYSPSLCSLDALLKLRVPIIVFDTTPDLHIAGVQDEKDCINDNHGIHGVQDMCAMLRRHGRSYTIAAGHAENSSVLDEVVSACRAAEAAKAFRNARVGTVGGSFEGMGDFLISEEDLRSRIGAETVSLGTGEGKAYEDAVTEEEIDREIACDKETFAFEVKSEEPYRKSIRSGLAIRKWIAEKELTALTVNFLKTDDAGLATMPFEELSKAMARNIGYAGEGDKLTAAMAGGLMSVYGDRVTFTEMFCPDWTEDLILLSHMGEANLKAAAWKPVLTDIDFPYNAYGRTAAAYFALKAGNAVLVNLSPTEGKMSMILTKVTLIDRGHEKNVYRYAMQGWMKPCVPVKDFLKAYSELGGTHHSVLVYDVPVEELAAFGRMMDFDVNIIE